ncbi:hypothetical protein [Neisseria sp. Ec49-e6-T10]|uniref:hypothetical protein n=1 Tax=Neisseria sp. Ec49-e6-T10 TaxID=3140744 RepID=UPI003EBA6BCD
MLAHLDKGLPVHVDIQKVLAQHEPELPDGQQKNINPERQKQINEQLALFKIDEQLAKFSPKQQELLKEIMVQLINKHAGDPPKLNLIRHLENKDELQLITANNKNLSFHPQQYLEQFKDQLQAERPPLSDERQKQINQLMQTHGVDMQFEQKFDQKHFNTLYGAIGYSIQNHTGTPPLVNDIRVDEKQINIELADGYQLKIDTQAVLNGEVDLENCAQRERLPVIAQRGETGESLGRKLDPENPKAAYGYLLATEQIKLIRGDDGHAIPNIRPDKAYHYDPNQYDQAQKQDLSKVAGLAIAKESQFNQALDQARAELAAQKKQEEQLKVQQQTEQANLNKGQMSEDPYYQQMRKEQKFDPLSYLNNNPKNDQTIVLATLGLMTPRFTPSSSPYSQRAPIQADKGFIDRALDKANALKNEVVQNYNHLENKVSQVLKVDANDHSWLAYGKRYAASQIGANKGAALWAEETVTGTVSLAVGLTKTVGTTQIQNIDNLSFGLLSKVMPNVVKESRAHNAEVAQTTLNIGKTVLNYSKDAALDNLNQYSFGTLGKKFDTIAQASQRQHERAEQILSWGTNQLKEGKEAYLTGDFNTQAKQVKVGIDIATVVIPFTKASTLNKGIKVADGLADISKVEKGLKIGDEVADLAKLTNKLDIESFQKFYKMAPEAKIEIDNIAEKIATKYDGVVAKAPIKSESRAIEKIVNEYDGDYLRIKDLARNTIVVDEKNIGQVVQDLKNSGAQIKVINSVDNPMGYGGVNSTIKTSTGLTAEIQVNSPAMIYAKESEEVAKTILGKELYEQMATKTGLPGGEGHKLYEQWRVTSDINLKVKLEEVSRKYYDDIRGKN